MWQFFLFVFHKCFSLLIVYAWPNEYTLIDYQRDLCVLVKEVQIYLILVPEAFNKSPHSVVASWIEAVIPTLAPQPPRKSNSYEV